MEKDKAPDWRRMKAQVAKDEGLSGEGQSPRVKKDEGPSEEG